MSFTLSARGKPASIPIQTYLRRNFTEIPVEQIDSFFGFTEYSSLYGGRIFTGPEISIDDIRAMYKMGINLRLPLSNHYATLEEYKANIPFLEKYLHPGNSIILTNDQLAEWIRADFPAYRLEASVIKNIDSLEKVEAAGKIYDSMILPMSANLDEAFLLSIENKDQITLFGNGGCAVTCPSKICYPSISKVNKTGNQRLFQCSQQFKDRQKMGLQNFDLEHLQSLGFHRFKLLRSRPGNMTGM